MKKIVWLFAFMILPLNIILANETELIENNKIQTRINNIGTDILNSNKLEKRVVFVYNEKDKENIVNSTKTITKRQVVVYGDMYKNIENDDELAGYIARQIPAAIRSYQGLGNGLFGSLKMKAAPKKYELIFDKLAVDYMVKAGYNPIGLITFINKTYPQVRQDKLSSKNLTSKRLAYIYERIYMKYPDFLINNEYLDNKYYQNFLLTSQKNREYASKRAKNPGMSKVYKYE